MGFLNFGCSLNMKKEHTIKESISLFEKANKTIRIIAGHLGSDFYKNSDTIKSLNNAISKGVDVRIGYYPYEYNEKAKKVFLTNMPHVHLLRLKAKPQRHWVSVDRNHVRIEHKHAENAIDTPALICNNARPLADELEDKLEVLAEK